MSNMNTCNYCQNPAFLRCSGCEIAYCTSQCQAFDWNFHKMRCFSESSDIQSIRSVSMINEDLSSKTDKPAKRIVISVKNKTTIPALREINKTTTSSVNMRLKRAQESEDVKAKSTVFKEINHNQQKINVASIEKADDTDKEIKIDEVPTDTELKVEEPIDTAVELMSELNLNVTEAKDIDSSLKIERNKSSEKFREVANVPDLTETPKRISKKTTHKSQKETNWKSHVQLSSSEKWIPMYIHLIKLDSEETSSSSQSIVLTPLESMPSLFNYLEVLTNFYRENTSELQQIDAESLKVGELLVIEYDQDYLYRAEVLSIEPEITLRLIDFGSTFKFEQGKMQAFHALKDEIKKPAFAIEAIVKNKGIFGELNDATDVLAKFISSNPKTVVLKPNKSNSTDGDDDEENDEGELNLRSQKSRFVNNGHFLANAIMRKDMTLGKNIGVFVLDTSSLVSNYELTIFEYNDNNVEFYENLNSEIDTYCENNKGNLGYMPMVNECILVSIGSKGDFNRAICLSISKDTSKITAFFIDYGNVEFNVNISKCMKLPAKLLYTACAITSKVRGIEMEIISNPTEIIKTFEDSPLINAELVEKIKDCSGRYQYYITLNMDNLDVK